jgi:hypothetical protein
MGHFPHLPAAKTVSNPRARCIRDGPSILFPAAAIRSNFTKAWLTRANAQLNIRSENSKCVSWNARMVFTFFLR